MSPGPLEWPKYSTRTGRPISSSVVRSARTPGRACTSSVPRIGSSPTVWRSVFRQVSQREAISRAVRLCMRIGMPRSRKAMPPNRNSGRVWVTSATRTGWSVTARIAASSAWPWAYEVPVSTAITPRSPTMKPALPMRPRLLSSAAPPAARHHVDAGRELPGHRRRAGHGRCAGAPAQPASAAAARPQQVHAGRETAFMRPRVYFRSASVFRFASPDL